MADPLFRKTFFPALEKKGVEDVVKAFVGRNQENALKKKPMVCLSSLAPQLQAILSCI